MAAVVKNWERLLSALDGRPARLAWGRIAPVMDSQQMCVVRRGAVHRQVFWEGLCALEDELVISRLGNRAWSVVMINPRVYRYVGLPKAQLEALCRQFDGGPPANPAEADDPF